VGVEGGNVSGQRVSPEWLAQLVEYASTARLSTVECWLALDLRDCRAERDALAQTCERRQRQNLVLVDSLKEMENERDALAREVRAARGFDGSFTAFNAYRAMRAANEAAGLPREDVKPGEQGPT
jgi:hypothetical protein